MRFLTPFLAAAALAPAFVPPLAQADTIKVGIANDISGPFAALGAEARDGFNLAIKQLGSKLGGQPAEFLQTDMGGNPDQVSEGKRLAWPEVRKDVGVTLSAIDNPDARAEGLRRVTRKLIEKRQPGLAEELAEQLSDGPGLFAVVGLEFQRVGEDARVQKLLKPYLLTLKM